MLSGFFRYSGYTYGISGYDFGDSMPFLISTDSYKAKKILDGGIYVSEDLVYPPSWDSYFFSVGMGNISVEMHIEKEEGKVIKNNINKEFFIRLGSVVRGMKGACTKENSEASIDGYDVAFNPSENIKHILPNGYVVLQTITIRELYYKDDSLELSLKEDNDFTLKIFKPERSYKFKLDLSEFIVEDNFIDWDFGDDHIFSLQEIIERNPNKSYVWLNDRKYTIVKEIEDVEIVCKKIWNHKGLVAFDTETTGLRMCVESRHGDGDKLVGMVFSIEPGEAWYFPIRHKKVKNICSPGEIGYTLEKYFKPILESKPLLCHNGSFDWKAMYTEGICINLVQDTFILFKVTIWNTNRSLGLGLKNLAKVFLNRDSFELSDFVVGKFGSNSVTFADLEEESVKYYACPDTDSLLDLYNYAMENDFIGTYGASKTYEMEVKFSIVIAYQEFYGHCVDMSRIDRLVEEINSHMSKAYKTMSDAVGHDFNPNSSPQLATVFIKELGYPVVATTDTGAPSTGKEARKIWMKQTNADGSPKYPLAFTLHDYATYSQLHSNFTKNLPKFATEDGLCFSEVTQFLETGRVSVKEPNYQSYNDTVKKYIIPREGFYALDADYSSVEARIMVSMAGCKNMVERLKDPDMDYHTSKASDMFGVPYELVSKDLRKMSKGVNFGILYGLGNWNLGVNLYGVGSKENSLRAKKQKELYFKGMDELRGFIDKSKAQGTTQFYSTTYFGRRRYYDPRKERTDRIERQSCNARIQGTAADIYKIAMVRLFHQICIRGWLGKVLISAFVHDECFLEVSKSLDPCMVLKVLRECMSLKIDGWCPLFIGCGFGRSWYEAKKTEIPVQVQDKFIDNWSDSGLDWWNGDTDKLFHWEQQQINDYRRDRVISYLKNPDNYGKVLHPVENALAHEALEEIQKKGVMDGVVDWNVEPKKDMLENLKEFCKAFGCEDLYEKADIQRPVMTSNATNEVDYDEESDDEFEYTTKDYIKMRINTIGTQMLTSSKGKEIYFRYDERDRVLMNLAYKLIESNPGETPVYAVKDGEIYETGMSMKSSCFSKLMSLFLMRRSLSA